MKRSCDVFMTVSACYRCKYEMKDGSPTVPTKPVAECVTLGIIYSHGLCVACAEEVERLDTEGPRRKTRISLP